MHKPTDEQAAIIEAVTTRTESLMVSAYAGCAKTSTIEMAAAQLQGGVSVIALAFNVKTKEELQRRLPQHFTVKNFNGLGHSAFAAARRKRMSVNQEKIYDLAKIVTNGQNLLDDQFTEVMALMRSARTNGMILREQPLKGLIQDEDEVWVRLAEEQMIDPEPLIIALARDLLRLSVAESFNGNIDFDDQIYMSALYTGLFPQFQVVIADEAQDLSPLNHLMIKKIRPQRIIAVGDPRQAIYAFRGADSNSMTNLKGLAKEWIELPLTTTFRCSQAVVRRQQGFVPDFRAAESNKEGAIFDWKAAPWKISDLPLSDNLAILCRNNAPIITMAMKLLAKQIGVTVLGKDIGKSLVTLVKKICGKKDSLSSVECAEKIDAWATKEIDKAKVKNQESRIATISDRSAALIAIIDNSEAETLRDIVLLLQKIFYGDGLITLATGHKSKGLEWKNVLHLNPNLIPSKFARIAKENGNDVPWNQDMNLRYVIETRAKENLYLAHLDDLEAE